MTVAVEFDPKSRKIRFDTDDPQLSWKQYKKDRKDGFEASLSAPAGTPVASQLSGLGGAAGRLRAPCHRPGAVRRGTR